MADDKKSFLLYADYIHTVRKLPTDKAGELFLTILSYVNDENPEPEDILVQLTFEPIKRQLKRDLKKWETSLQKKSDAGLNSSVSKFKAKILANLQDVDIDFEIGYCDKKIIESGGNDPYFEKCKEFLVSIQQEATKSTGVESVATQVNTSQQTPTKSTVTDTVTVNDTVIVNIVVGEDERSETEMTQYFDVDVGLRRNWEQKGLPREKFVLGVQLWFWQNIGKKYKDIIDVRQHFLYWMPNFYKAAAEAKKENNGTTTNNKTGKLSRGEAGQVAVLNDLKNELGLNG